MFKFCLKEWVNSEQLGVSYMYEKQWPTFRGVINNNIVCQPTYDILFDSHWPQKGFFLPTCPEVTCLHKMSFLFFLSNCCCSIPWWSITLLLTLKKHEVLVLPTMLKPSGLMYCILCLHHTQIFLLYCLILGFHLKLSSAMLWFILFLIFYLFGEAGK